MAGISHQVWNVALLKSEDDENGQGTPKRAQSQPITSRNRSLDSLWQEFFKDPSQWWDKRLSKLDPGYPDFKHKLTKESLRIDGRYNPSWVSSELHRRGLLTSADTPPEQNGDVSAFLSLLKNCARNRDLKKGSTLHDEIFKKGLLSKCSDALATMYARCGALSKARELLDTHNSTNIVAWTALISAYARQGQGRHALDCFECMQGLGLSPDGVTYSCVLKACGSIGAADKGKQIHDEIARQGLLQNDVVLGTALVDMYAKCGALAQAQQVLEELPFRDVVAWNALLTGYAQQGQADKALNCFEKMRREGLAPSAVSFSCILKACGTIGSIEKGEQVHSEIVRRALLENDLVLGTMLVEMYVKCGALEKAQCVLEQLSARDVITWSALIAGYAEQGQGEKALNCFERMQEDGLMPDAVTYAFILKACSSIKAVEMGEHIHDKIVRAGLLRDNVVLGTALVDMYAKFGELEKAQQVLEGLSTRDDVSWNVLIAGYAQHGRGEEALECFEQMKQEGFFPSAVTFSCILKACASIGAVDKGEQIHDEVVKQGLLASNIVVGTALVDMYAKCGALSKAQAALEEMPSRGVISWNALITGYAQGGQAKQVLDCFERMQGEGLSPNAATFSCVLNACSHLGLVEDAHMHFVSMTTKYGLEADIEHYTCMIDLFGRAGHLDKAARLVQETPSSDYPTIWSALLGSCRKWGNVEVGRWAFEQAKQVDKSDSVPYVLLADIYADAGMQEDAKNIEAMRMAMERSKVASVDMQAGGQRSRIAIVH